MTKEEVVEHLKSIKSLVDKYDDIVALREAIKALEQEPCNNAISRQAVIEMAYDVSEIDGEHFIKPHMVIDIEDIQKLPPVNPQEPILDKIREEIIDTLYVDSLIFGELIDFRNGKISADDVIEEFNRVTRKEVLHILDKYKIESEEV